MPLTNAEKNQEIMSLALEDRSSGYQDLVSDNHPVLAILRKKGRWKTFSGPTIRERLQYAQSGNTIWYNGLDFLKNSPAELFNDAEFRPKMLAVGVTLSGEEVLINSGENQLMDVLEAHIEAAETELLDEVEISIQGDGSRFGGKELGGLRLALPTVNNAGVYGNISRVDNPIWRPGVYDANSFATGIGTQVTKDTIRPFLSRIVSQRSRGKQRADLFLMSEEHYAAYDAATVAIQRINDETSLGKLGFQSLKYFGAGGTGEIVQAAGIGSTMPSDTTYGLATDNWSMRYHSERNFNKIGKTMMPINQDANVQYIGFMGELTFNNSLFSWKLYDSNPAA